MELGYRYKVKVTVEDDSGSATFVMFDREVFQIIQVSAVDIKDKLSKVNNFNNIMLYKIIQR